MKPLLDAIATKPQKLEHAISITDAADMSSQDDEIGQPEYCIPHQGDARTTATNATAQNYPLARKFRYLAPFLRESSR